MNDPNEVLMYCKICKHICYCPICLPCGHRFCELCLDLSVDFFEKGRICPFCGVKFDIDEAIEDKRLQRWIQNLIAKNAPIVFGRNIGMHIREKLEDIMTTYATERNFKRLNPEYHYKVNETYFTKFRPPLLPPDMYPEIEVLLTKKKRTSTSSDTTPASTKNSSR